MSPQADYVRETGRARQVIDAVERILPANRALPDQVFEPSYACFAFFDYAVLQNAACWLELLDYASSATLVSLSPSAEDILARSGGERYGIVQLGPRVEATELAATLSTSPTENPADAFVFGCMRCVVVVESGGCAIFGDRYWDLAVAAFRSQASRARFRDFTRSWPYMAVGDAAERVTFQSALNDRSSFVAALKANYPNATPFLSAAADRESGDAGDFPIWRR